jgi:hypothetical protein
MPWLNYYGSLRHQQDCLTKPVVPSLLWGSVFTGINVAQGAPLTPGSFALNIGALYAYNAVQCPMEALHGRPSLLHNGLAAGTLGSVGVQSGVLGVPFVPPHVLYSPRYNPLMIAFAVYGGLGMAVGSLSGKPI